ncbi:MAG: hypothetical protein JO222_05755 [Frankiales bacterium]|nr:hypothetical protein [Frankiales bacterium]
MTTLGVRAQPRVVPPPTAGHEATVPLLVAVVVGVVHALLVAPHYAVGSFDDDGHYLSMAHALASGKGYVDTSAPGAPTEGVYPPGYAAVLVPLVWLFGHFGAGVLDDAIRGLSLLAFCGSIVVLDALLRRRATPLAVRGAVLLLFALNPLGATFATEVMPESVFLFVFLLVLYGLSVIDDDPQSRRRWSVVVALGAPYLLIAKWAGLPMLLGVCGWLLWRRNRRLLLWVLGATVLMVAPVLLSRLGAGAVIGDRYTSDYGHSGPLIPAAWSGLRNYISFAVPQSLVPTQGAFLYGHAGVLDVALDAVRVTAAPLVMLGMWRWWRQRLDATPLIVVLYLAETLPYPFINERRIILVLPLAVAWYVFGWWQTGSLLRLAATRLRVRRLSSVPAYGAVLPALFVVGLLVDQMPRDYLLRLGQSTPHAEGSGYVAALRTLTPPAWSISTAYRWTFAGFTGRPATNVVHFTLYCPPGQPMDIPAVRRQLASLHVATVVDADVKWPGVMDNGCVLDALSASSWAVPVYTGTDRATVFALTGPGTPRPDGSLATATGPLPSGAVVREVSAEVTQVPAAAVARAVIEVRRSDGTWQTLPTARSSVRPVLLDARAVVPADATAVRIVGLPRGAVLLHVVVFGHRA